MCQTPDDLLKRVHAEMESLNVPNALSLLIDATTSGGLIPPGDDEAIRRLWIPGIQLLLKVHRLPKLAAKVALRLYDHLSDLQSKHKCRYHKGTGLQQAAIAFRHAGDDFWHDGFTVWRSSKTFSKVDCF